MKLKQPMYEIINGVLDGFTTQVLSNLVLNGVLLTGVIVVYVHFGA